MSNPVTKKLIQVLNILGFIGTIVINTLAVTLPLNGKSTGALSDMYPNLFVPAGLIFSIWGVIYILLLLFSIYQARDLFKKGAQNMPFLDKIGWFFVFASILNMAWIFAWHYQQVLLSLFIMILLFICLLIIYLRLNIGINSGSKGEKYMVHLPFSVYIGWISVALVANASAFLVNIHWDRFGLTEVFWTAAMIIIVTLITMTMLFRRNDIPYSLVIIWAFIGIILKRTAVEANPSGAIIISLIAGITLILLSIGIRFKKWLDY